MTIKRRRLALAMFALSLVACSGKPTDAEAVRLFGEDNKRLKALKFFDVENPKRINGYERDGYYVVEMQFDIIPKLDSDELTMALVEMAGTSFFGQQQLAEDLAVLKREYGAFKKGQRFTKTRPVVLRRTEAGWTLAT